MYDFGVTHNHANAVTFGDIDALDAPTSLSIACWFYLLATGGTARGIIEKFDGNGIELRMSTAEKFQFRGDGVGAGTNDTAIAINELHSIVFTWDGTNTAWYLDGVADGTGSFAGPITANTAVLGIPTDAAGNGGMASRIGHPMIWHNTVLDADDAALYNAGVIPQPSELTFHVRGTELPGTEEVSGAGGTIQNTVTLTETDPPDSYYAEGLGVGLEPTRRRATRELRSRRSQHGRPVVVGGFELLQVPPLKHLQASHPLAPNELGTGWGVKSWERRLLRRMRRTIDFESRTVSIQTRDEREHLATLWLRGKTGVQSPERLDGVPELTRGPVARTFERAANAYIEDALGNVTRINWNNLKTEPNGIMFEGDTRQLVTDGHFSAASITTNWTLLNNATNGSSIAYDTTETLFEPGTSPNSVKIVAGNPLGGNDYGIQQVITAPATDRYLISVDHKDDSGFALSWILQRASDSWFWNDATPAWQSGTVDNDMPISTERTRFFSRAIQQSSATNWTLSVFANTEAGQINHVYYVQDQEGPVGGSRLVILNDTTPGDSLFYLESSLKRMFNPQHGSVKVKFRPLYRYDDINYQVITYYLWEYWVADDGEGHQAYEMLYNSSTEKYNFRLNRIAGKDGAAADGGSVMRGELRTVVGRWSGIAGELDQSTGGSVRTFWVDVFDENATLIASDVNASVPFSKSPAPNAQITVGATKTNVTDDSSWMWLEEVEMRPFVLTNEEVQEWVR